MSKKKSASGSAPKGRLVGVPRIAGGKGRGLPRAPGNPDQLHAWLRRHLDVHLPRSAVVAGHAAPFDYLAHVFFEGAPPVGAACGGVRPASDIRDAKTDVLVWANRGGGKTYLGALATLLDMLYKPSIGVRVLAGSLEQSRRMLHYLHGFFMAEGAFLAMIKGRATAGRIRLSNGSEVEVLAQSQTSVRGTHVQKLRCDEVDLFDPEIWDAAQFVTHAKQCGPVFVRGGVECLSTMQRPYGLMHRLLMEAQEGKRKLFKWGRWMFWSGAGMSGCVRGWRRRRAIRRARCGVRDLKFEIWNLRSEIRKLEANLEAGMRTVKRIGRLRATFRRRRSRVRRTRGRRGR
jgi:hypothetical protein